MVSHALTYPSLQRRRRWAFFWARGTQQVRRMRVAREIVRALVALCALVAWMAVAFLLAG